LGWIRDAGKNGIILFESAVRGELQDELRQAGYQVIGGSAYGDRLENEREFGQETLSQLGLSIVQSHRFTNFSSAIDFIRQSPARYVYKVNDANSQRTKNYVGEMDSGTDMMAFLQLQKSQWGENWLPDFVLMEYIEGVEVGVGAFFNGEEFLRPILLDFEHKRLFPGELGELTGEMGTVVTYRGGERIFELSLGRMQDLLRAHGYCGYINLNLIANEHGLWPLEFTSRFGYPGSIISEALHDEPWESIFRKLIQRDTLQFATRPGFATGVVLTVPTFPYEHGYEALGKGTPIFFRDNFTAEDRNHLRLGEVAMQDGQLFTSGLYGYLGVATGTGSTVTEASDQAYEVARKVVAPNLRYRNDIGERVSQGGWNRLAELGYVSLGD
ncbi:MAG TPA: phosphoribosylamine--glycine ligase, partial [Methylophilaceae bacterium]|nr:phosphoribosylamine--glycine ligase [Methylophilaceae bacterium]